MSKYQIKVSVGGSNSKRLADVIKTTVEAKFEIYSSDTNHKFDFYKFIQYIEDYSPEKEYQKNPEYLETHKAIKGNGLVVSIDELVKSKVKEYLAELSQSDDFIEAIKAKIMPKVEIEGDLSEEKKRVGDIIEKAIQELKGLHCLKD